MCTDRRFVHFFWYCKFDDKNADDGSKQVCNEAGRGMGGERREVFGWMR